MSWMKNMMPGMGAVGDLMKVMPQIGKMQEVFKNSKGMGQARNGLVKATTHKAEDLTPKLASLSIDRSLIDASKPEVLENLIMEAVNDSFKNEAEQMKQAVMSIKDS